MTELLSCPFCGGEAHMPNKACNVAEVACLDCRASVWGAESRGYDEAVAAAAAAWNTRVATPAAEGSGLAGGFAPRWQTEGDTSAALLRPTPREAELEVALRELVHVTAEALNPKPALKVARKVLKRTRGAQA